MKVLFSGHPGLIVAHPKKYQNIYIFVRYISLNCFKRKKQLNSCRPHEAVKDAPLP